MNPCPCGYAGHPLRACRCTPLQRERYAGRISGPLLDRIDLCVEVPWLPPDVLGDDRPQESRRPSGRASCSARGRQAARCRETGVPLNALLKGRDAPAVWPVRTRPGAALLDAAVRRLALSGRAHDRILRVARTIADLAGRRESGGGACRRGAAVPRVGG